MAKFAQVGYGSQGQGAGQDGDGYTYLVNDNVRTGDTISPAVRHYRNGKIFGTTGVVLSQTKMTTQKAQELKEEVKAKNTNVQEVLTGKQLGIGRTTDPTTGKFIKDKSTHNEKGEYIVGKREETVRGANIRYMEQSTGNDISQGEATQKAIETFDSYSAKYKQGD